MAVSDGTGLHFVLVFDPAHRGTSGGAVGRDSSAVPLPAVAGETAVLGVFCQTNEALSVAVSVGPAVRGADDPVLRDLLDRVTAACSHTSIRRARAACSSFVGSRKLLLKRAYPSASGHTRC